MNRNQLESVNKKMTTPRKQTLSKFSRSIKKTSLFETIKAKVDTRSNFLLSKIRRLPMHRAQKPVRKPIDFLIWPDEKRASSNQTS